MEKIPTAEEFLKSKGLGGYQEFDGILQEFAKMHVEAALKEASENAKVQMGDDCILNKIAIHPNSLVDTAVIKVNSASILNSYPTSNIK